MPCRSVNAEVAVGMVVGVGDGRVGNGVGGAVVAVRVGGGLVNVGAWGGVVEVGSGVVVGSGSGELCPQDESRKAVRRSKEKSGRMRTPCLAGQDGTP